MIELTQANALRIPLADESVQVCVTSPPYFGLRSYSLSPLIWGRREECRHVWKDGPPAPTKNAKQGSTESSKWPAVVGTGKDKAGQFCQLCGAWRGSLGLEPDIRMYVQHLVEIFREVRRVLRKDGTVFLDLGDSYSSGNRASQCNPSGNTGQAGLSGGLHRAPANVPGLKSKDLCMIPARVALALQADGWWLRSDIIWCLSGGARVYAKTQKGEMPMMIKDMVRLDPATVKLWNGKKWTQALGWKESSRPDAPLELELRSGERIGCTPGHVWPTQRGNIRADELQIGDVIQHTILPAPEFQDHEGLPSHLVGWFIGLFIAEGSYSGNTIQISGHLNETRRFEKLQHIAQMYDGTCAMHQTSKNGATINLHSQTLLGILADYISGKRAKGKHLTTKAWQRDNVFLSSILDGYLEGDGHFDATNNRWRIGFTRNYNWENDLRTICARLGVQLTLKLAWAKYQNGKLPSFRGEIRFNVSGHHNVKDRGEVMRIGRSKARKFWDIAVADEPHLFALASGVLTHNSKTNPMPESVTDRPTKSHEYVFLLAKNKKYFYDQDAIREPHKEASQRRYKYGLNSVYKDASLYGGKQSHNFCNTERLEDFINPAGRNKRTVWTIPTKGYKGSHFAVFPEALVTPCIKAGTSEKGCCPKCGKAWVRVVARSSNLNTERPQARRALELVKRKGLTQEHIDAIQAVGMADAGKALLTMGGAGKNRPEVQRLADEAKQLLGGYFREFTFNNRVTTGWRPACDCWKTACDERGMTYDEDYEHFNHLPEWLPELTPVPCIVLDPFCGSGTTLLAARKLGRSAIGLDLSYPYLDQARTRLELDKLSEWESGREPAQTNLDDLPLWAAKNT